MSTAVENEVVIRASGLEKHFMSGDRKITVLQGLDFVLRRGESVSIRGESGSGKTTLLNLLTGMEVPDAGTVLWEGNDIAKLSANGLATLRGQKIGMVFQAFCLIPELNALENVSIAARILGCPAKEAALRAEELLAEVGLGDRLKSQALQLSGGERQRVAFARALINRPEVIFADEPTGNLDEATSRRVMDVLLETTGRRQTSFVLVTHNPAHARETQRQLVLRLGKFEQE